MKKHVTKAMREGVFVIDGAMGTAVQSMEMDTDRDYLGRENCTLFISSAIKTGKAVPE
jgi:5-methyltetrahydrofolate--homocysteine methyltransferase